jgi:hypothetical protein
MHTRAIATATASQPQQPQSRRSNPFALEGLERRTFFSVTLVFDADGNAGLRVVGTSGADSITIQDDPTTDQPSVVGAGAVPALGANDILFYVIDGLGGSDTITFSVPTDYSSDIRGISVNLGSGNDSFQFSTQDIDNGSAISVEIEGLSGRDTLGSNVLNLNNESTFDLLIDSGTDSDVVATSIDQIVNSSSLNQEVYLGTGTTNSLDATVGFIGTLKAELFARGEGGADTVIYHLTGDVLGFLEVNSFLGNGADTMTVDLGSFVDIQGFARFDMNGGGGNDSLNVLLDRTNTDFVVAGNASIGGLDINMQGGAGNDTLTLDLIRDTDLETELTGNLRVRMSGGDGRDTIVSKIQFDSSSTGIANLRFNGDSGDDLFQDFTLIDNSFGGVSLTGGFVLVDGGSSPDTRSGTNVVGFGVGISDDVRFLRFDTIIP